MPTLDETKSLIWQLSKKKGWGEEVATKIYYAMIELGEAGDCWKHRGDPEYLMNNLKITVDEVPDYMMEEFIDALFYIFHAMMCLDPDLSADEAFQRKFKINENRNRVYVDDKLEG